jgi:hypothetical protein
MATLVPLILDLYDGAINPVISGTASLTPSVQLTDPGTGIVVTSGPSVTFRPSNPVPLTWILPTDVSGWAPSGWGWNIAFSSSFPGSPAGYSFKITSSGALFSFTATSASPAVFTASGSSLTNGTVVALAPGSSLPGGFRSNTTYYVVDASGDTFSLAATEGGSALASTSSGSGTVGVVQYLSSLSPQSSVTSTFPLNPMTTPGDIIWGGTDGIPQRLAGNTADELAVLTQTGTGSASAEPEWQTAGSELAAALGALPLPSATPQAGQAPVTTEADSTATAWTTVTEWLAPSDDQTGAADQTAITAAEGRGYDVHLGPGTFYVQGLAKQASTLWKGSGRLATILQLASGMNADVIQGADFTSLTLSGSITGGIGGWGIRDLTIDGNKANQSGTSYGLRVYGYNFDLSDLDIRNCYTDDLYTEWGNFGGSEVAGGSIEARYRGVKLHGGSGNGWVNRGPHDSRAFDVTVFGNSTSGYGYWGQSESLTNTTVASGSNGVNVDTFEGAGVLNVNTTLGYPAASINSTQGSLTVATSAGTAVITYTGITATSFTGCTTVSGSGTLSTGGAVQPTGGAYSSAGTLLHACHVYGTPLWDYVLDTDTHLLDCIGEVPASGGGMVLIRGGSGARIKGGYYFAITTSPGCGIQVGDSVNPCAGADIDTHLWGMTGGSAALASVSLVNDGGQNSIRAFVYQAANAAYTGTPSALSTHQIQLAGQTAGNNAAGSLWNIHGPMTLDVGSATTGLDVKNNGTTNFNVNTASKRVELPQGMTLQGWSDGYSTETGSIDFATGVFTGPDSTIINSYPWVPSDNGLLIANGDPALYLTASSALSAGIVYLVKLTARYALTISNLWWNCAAAGSGSSTGSYTGLYSLSGGSALTGSSDIGSLFTGTAEPVECALTTPQNLTAGESVWAAIVFNLASTQPELFKGVGSIAAAGNAGLTVSTARWAQASGSGHTSLPSITPANNTFTTDTLWAGGS